VVTRAALTLRPSWRPLPPSGSHVGLGATLGHKRPDCTGQHRSHWAICPTHPTDSASYRVWPRFLTRERTVVEACIGLAAPGRPIGPWSRRTGAPEASATRRDRTPRWSALGRQPRGQPRTTAGMSGHCMSVGTAGRWAYSRLTSGGGDRRS
jgi:hypothetical protein